MPNILSRHESSAIQGQNQGMWPKEWPRRCSKLVYDFLLDLVEENGVAIGVTSCPNGWFRAKSRARPT